MHLKFLHVFMASADFTLVLSNSPLVHILRFIHLPPEGHRGLLSGFGYE